MLILKLQRNFEKENTLFKSIVVLNILNRRISRGESFLYCRTIIFCFLRNKNNLIKKLLKTLGHTHFESPLSFYWNYKIPT